MLTHLTNSWTPATTSRDCRFRDSLLLSPVAGDGRWISVRFSDCPSISSGSARSATRWRFSRRRSIPAFAGTSFEYFRGWLVEGLGYGDGARGGRPPFDPVSMFKALILQAQHNLSDAKMEFMIRDRLSWMRFLKFDLGGPTPDENKGPPVPEQTHRDRHLAAGDESLRLAAAAEGLPADVRPDRRRHPRSRAQAAQQ